MTGYKWVSQRRRLQQMLFIANTKLKKRGKRFRIHSFLVLIYSN